MSFRGHRPIRMPRLGSFIDQDDPTVTVPGLANVGKNVRYDSMTVATRYGTERTFAMTPGKDVRGLAMLTLLARSAVPVQQTTIITAQFLDTTQVTGSVAIAKSFQLLNLNIPHACRVRLYRSQAGRDADLSRDVNTEYVGTELIYDLNADTAFSFPLDFNCLFEPGTATDPLPTTTVYWTVDRY